MYLSSFFPACEAGAASPGMQRIGKSAFADRWLLRRILLPILIPVSCLVLVGCAGRLAATTPASSRSYSSPEAALRAISASAPAATITATARIEISRNGGHPSLKVALMMRKPAFLRVESIPLMGPPDFLLSAANGQLRVFLAGQGEGTFYIGQATQQNLSRFFPLSLPPQELVSLLLGEVWPVEDNGTSFFFLRGEQEKNLYRVDQYSGERMLRSLWIDPAGDILVKLRIFAKNGDSSYTADFADHTRVGEGLIPRKITLSQTSSPSMTLRYTDLQQVTDNTVVFPLSVPEGIKPTSLD